MAIPEWAPLGQSVGSQGKVGSPCALGVDCGGWMMGGEGYCPIRTPTVGDVGNLGQHT